MHSEFNTSLSSVRRRYNRNKRIEHYFYSNIYIDLIDTLDTGRFNPIIKQIPLNEISIYQVQMEVYICLILETLFFKSQVK